MEKVGSIDSNGNIMNELFQIVGHLGKDFAGNPGVKDSLFRTVGTLTKEVLEELLKT